MQVPNNYSAGCSLKKWRSYWRHFSWRSQCVITSTLFEMTSTCMRSCDLNFSWLSTSITAPEVSGCQNNKRIQYQYGRSCLHLVSSNFNFVNWRQLLAFRAQINKKKLISFVSFSIIVINAYIWTFVSKWFFTMWVLGYSVYSQMS